MPAPSMASMGTGKLMVVTRLVATGTETATRSSSQTCWMGWDGCAWTTATLNIVTVNRTEMVCDNLLAVDFIFEVAHSGGETSVQGHVGVAQEAEPERERKRLGERLVLENAATDDLAGDGGEHLVVARGENIDLADFGFLVQLLGAELDGLLDFLVLRLAERRFEEHQFEQIRVVEISGVAFEERHRREFGLLDVQILRLRKLEQRTQIICAGGINDDDALA